jgi:hypothetical protein
LTFLAAPFASFGLESSGIVLLASRLYAAEEYFASFDARWDRVGRKAIPIGRLVRAYSPVEYGAVSAEDFLRLAEETCARPLAELAERWGAVSRP